MNTALGTHATISLEDLQLTSEIISERSTDPGLEMDRQARARHLVNCAYRLKSTMTIHTRCIVANHFGAERTHNLPDVTEAFFSALADYAAAVCDFAAYGHRDLPGYRASMTGAPGGNHAVR